MQVLAIADRVTVVVAMAREHLWRSEGVTGGCKAQKESHDDDLEQALRDFRFESALRLRKSKENEKQKIDNTKTTKQDVAHKRFQRALFVCEDGYRSTGSHLCL